jgi:hypothetical protein
MITVTEQLKNVFEANPLYSKEGQGLNAEVIARSSSTMSGLYSMDSSPLLFSM